MRSQLEKVPEDRRKTVIDACYEDLSGLYKTVARLGEYWGLNLDVQGKPMNSRDNTTWDEFANSLNAVESGYRKIKEKGSADLDIKESVHVGCSTEQLSNACNEYLKNLREAGFTTPKPDKKIIRDVSLYVNITNLFGAARPDVPMVKNGEVVPNLEDELYELYLIIRKWAVNSKYPLEKTVRYCNKIMEISDSNETLKSRKNDLTFVATILNEIATTNYNERKEDVIERQIKKVRTRIIHIANKKLPEEKIQSDLIEDSYNDLFRRLPKTITEDERGLKNTEFVRSVAAKHGSLDKGSYEKLHELTGIEYMLLFHTVGDKRELTESEKKAYSSITGQDFK